MRAKSARFVASAAGNHDWPVSSLPEVAFVGRSNVGKSTLINHLANHQGLARTSRTPGRTRLLNWFEVLPPKGGAMHFVDLPGYGYAAVGRDMREGWRPLIERYLTDRKQLAAVVLLLDIRRGVEDEELDFVPWLAAAGRRLIPVVTKIDKLSKSQRTPVLAEAKKALGLTRLPLGFSSLNGEGDDDLWKAILAAVSAHAKS